MTHRNIRIVNLDPAAEKFNYEPLADVRDLIQVEDVMEAEDLQLGKRCLSALVISVWRFGDTFNSYMLSINFQVPTVHCCIVWSKQLIIMTDYCSPYSYESIFFL